MCGVQTYVRGGGVVRVVVRVRMDEGVRCVTMMFPCTQGVIESSFRLTFRRAEAGVYEVGTYHRVLWPYERCRVVYLSFVFPT